MRVRGDREVHRHAAQERGEVARSRSNTAMVCSTAGSSGSSTGAPASPARNAPDQASSRAARSAGGQVVGAVDDVVGVPGEAVQRVHVRPLPRRQQPGRQVVGAAVRTVQLAAAGVGAGQGRPLQPPIDASIDASANLRYARPRYQPSRRNFIRWERWSRCGWTRRATGERPDRPGGDRRSRPRRARLRAAAGRRRPRGHRGRARGAPGRAGRPARPRRLRVRHRPDRAHHARPARRDARRGRREPRRLARADRARSGLPRALPGRLDAGRHHRPATAWPAEIARVCGPREADGYLRFVDYARRLWQLERADFIDRNLDTPRDLLTANLLRLLAAGGFGRLQPKIDQLLPGPAHPPDLLVPGDVRRARPARRARPLRRHRLPRLGRRRLLPARAASTPCPRALAGAAEKHGVDVPLRHHGHRASRRAAAAPTGVRHRRRRAHPGRRRGAQPRPAGRLRDLLPGRGATDRLRYSPSCVVLHVGSSAGVRAQIAHHNIHFGRSWRAHLRRGHQPRRADERPVAAGHQPQPHRPVGRAGRPAHVLRARARCRTSPPAPTWTGAAASPSGYSDELVETLEARGYVGFGAGIEVRRMVTPADWADQGMAAGTPFAAAHTLRQTGPFRPGQPAPDTVQCGLRRLGHAARRRRAHGPHLRPAGRPADHGSVPMTRPGGASGRAGRRRGRATGVGHRRRGAPRRRASCTGRSRCCSSTPTGRFLLQRRAAVKTRFAAALGQRLLRPPGARARTVRAAAAAAARRGARAARRCR